MGVGAPIETTPLVGRRRELDAIKRLMESSRLVTLTGTGGAGKTRLARRLAIDLARTFRGKVHFVELADVQDGGLIGHTITASVGLQVKSAEFDIAALAEHFGDSRVLLVVDNCEHVVEDCGQILDDLLVRCEGVRVVATSQRALGLVGESVFAVPPLKVPAGDVDVRPEALAHYEAVMLFVDRAAALKPEFSLTAGNAKAVVELCRALEGVPLALELAAARIRVLSPHAMVDRLSDRYRLLSHGYGGRVPERQRSLEASVQWTYDLCSEGERRLWANLSCFRGGMALEAVEAVAGDRPDGEDLIDLLSALVDKSVLVRDGDEDRVRYRMLETLRLYGARCLEERGELDLAERRHRDYFVDLTKRYAKEWTGPRQVEWLRCIGDEHANIRSALQYSIERDEPGPALAILADLESFWVNVGLVSEARRWFTRAFAGVSQGVEGLAPALRVAAWFALVQTDLESAEAITAGLRVLAAEASEDAVSTKAQAVVAEGLLCAWQGRTADGIRLIERSTPMFRELGDLSMVTFTLTLSGMLLGFEGEHARAEAAQRASLEVTEPCGELYMRSFAYAMLGIVALEQGNLTGASGLLRKCLVMNRTLGDLLGLAVSLEFLAWIAVAEDRGERAAALLGAAGGIWDRLGVSLGTMPHFSERRAASDAAARAKVSPDAFSKAVQQGAAMSTGAAITFALEEAAVPAAGDQPRDLADSALTRREWDVARLLAEGQSNRQIADRLVISVRTAEAHVDNILRKLGFSSRHAVVAWVAERDLDRAEAKSVMPPRGDAL